MPCIRAAFFLGLCLAAAAQECHTPDQVQGTNMLSLSSTNKKRTAAGLLEEDQPGRGVVGALSAENEDAKDEGIASTDEVVKGEDIASSDGFNPCRMCHAIASSKSCLQNSYCLNRGCCKAGLVEKDAQGAAEENEGATDEESSAGANTATEHGVTFTVELKQSMAPAHVDANTATESDPCVDISNSTHARIVSASGANTTDLVVMLCNGGSQPVNAGNYTCMGEILPGRLLKTTCGPTALGPGLLDVGSDREKYRYWWGHVYGYCGGYRGYGGYGRGYGYRR